MPCACMHARMRSHSVSARLRWIAEAVWGMWADVLAKYRGVVKALYTNTSPLLCAVAGSFQQPQQGVTHGSLLLSLHQPHPQQQRQQRARLHLQQQQQSPPA